MATIFRRSLTRAGISLRIPARSIAGADHPFVIRSPSPDVEISDANFNDCITQEFHKHGDRTAITVALPDGSVDVRSFADLLKDVDSVASELQTELGFKKGDTALLVSPNHADYFTVVHAILRLGGVLSPANPLYTAHEIANQLRDSQATVVVAHPMCLEAATSALGMLAAEGDQRPKRLVVLGEKAPPPVDNASGVSGGEVIPLAAMKGTGRGVASLGAVPSNQLAILPYSSGTTGLPKGTMLTHRNMVANVAQFEDPNGKFWQKDGGEVLISPLPFFHIYGFTASLNIALFYGCEVVTMPQFDLMKFLTLCRDKKATQAQLVPPIIIGLAKHPAVSEFLPLHLKCITSGAAPLGTDVGKAAAARLGCSVNQAWGMSELAPIGTLNPKDKPRDGTSGLPVANMLYKVVDTETGEILPRNKEGEVVCTGPNVMEGYLNNPAANESAFDADGWFRTGDIGYFDEDGYMTLTDRLKELIKFKGFQVPPAELEALLLTHPAVLDSAVVARADDAAGEVPVAFVVVKPDATEGPSPDEIAAWVAERVAPHKKLRGGVYVLDAIPKSASGKILRRVLVDRDRAGEFKKQRKNRRNSI